MLTQSELDAIRGRVADYERTNTWMFTEDMSLLHAHAPDDIAALLATVEELQEEIQAKSETIRLLETTTDAYGIRDANAEKVRTLKEALKAIARIGSAEVYEIAEMALRGE